MSNYRVIKKYDGTFACEIMIQDGWERWTEKTLDIAIGSVVAAARAYNHVYIHRNEVVVFEEEPPLPKTCQADLDLLSDIKRGAKIVLDCRDYRVDYRITQEEADLILAVREGRVQCR